MPKQCDHKSVGMLVWRDDKLLLIERAKFPFGFAPPAGHVDGDPLFEDAARRELKEEVGLEATGLKLLFEGRKDNPCHREGGNWHYSKLYEVTTIGEVKRSEDETKQVGFYSKEDLKLLAQKTEKFLSGKTKEKEWEDSPGLEPAWYEWLKELKII